MDYKSLCFDLAEIVMNNGEFIRREAASFKREQVELKGTNDLVSYIDREAEKRLVRDLKKILKGAAFLTEEGTIEAEREAEYTWIIDPVDGTTNYVSGIPLYSTSVALQHVDKGTVIGLVYELTHEECFYSWLDGPSFLNEVEINVSATENTKDCITATGFPYDNPELVDQLVPILHRMLHGTRAIRRFGSAAVDLAYVACGRFDAYYEFGLNPWDCAGGALIVQNAGGKVSGLKSADYLYTAEILATNGKVHEAYRGLIEG